MGRVRELRISFFVNTRGPNANTSPYEIARIEEMIAQVKLSQFIRYELSQLWISAADTRFKFKADKFP